jgi:exodeoxyribonuclease VII small subunit
MNAAKRQTADAPPEQAVDSAQSFESAVGELDSLVARMESGELSLEQSLAAYKRGAQLVQFCRRTLTDVQQQVKILEGDLFKSFEQTGDSFGQAASSFGAGQIDQDS